MYLEKNGTSVHKRRFSRCRRGTLLLSAVRSSERDWWYPGELDEILEASLAAQKNGVDDPQINLECHRPNDNETRCVAQLDSRELKVAGTDHLFGLVGGTAFLRRGCVDEFCDEPKPKVWWRTWESELSGGEKQYTLEICNIEWFGVGLDFTGPLKGLGSFAGRFIDEVKINGMKLIVESQKQAVLTTILWGNWKSRGWNPNLH